MQPLPNDPAGSASPRPATPAAGFAPVTPIGDTPLLSLVPPAMQGEAVRHPDPISRRAGEQQPLPTSAQIPVAPVRRRRPVTPLIALPTNASLQAALQVTPIIPGQSLSPQPIQAGPSAYGVQPTTFPFYSAPPFAVQPQMQGFMPPPMPMQQYVAFVTLMAQPPQQLQQPQFMPQQPWAPQPPYPAMPHQYSQPVQFMPQPQQYSYPQYPQYAPAAPFGPYPGF
ncbi:MAG: hypothetical protein JHD02_08285 [Thermoleophilaceae bacterium]|nr:hypothetical protein [Thermoleophilaceae bacterium]